MFTKNISDQVRYTRKLVFISGEQMGICRNPSGSENQVFPFGYQIK